MMFLYMYLYIRYGIEETVYGMNVYIRRILYRKSKENSEAGK